MESNLNDLTIIIKDVRGKLFYVDFDSINFDNLRAINHPVKPLISGRYGDECIPIFGSCNGLLCLINTNYRIIELWNISTRDYEVLVDESMEVTSIMGEISYFYGFGYDAINDDYKIVRVAQEVKNPIGEVKIYSLKTSEWKRGKAIPYYFCDNPLAAAGTFVCGALHWVAIKERTWESLRSVIAFDVATEKYCQIELVDNMERKAYNLVLSALQGCLSVTAPCFDNTVKVWMMRGYGVKESWAMLYSFQGTYPLRPLAYSRTGDRLLIHQVDKSLLWYDLKENRLEKVDLPQLNDVRAEVAEICVGSLVQLDAPTSYYGLI